MKKQWLEKFRARQKERERKRREHASADLIGVSFEVPDYGCTCTLSTSKKISVCQLHQKEES